MTACQYCNRRIVRRNGAWIDPLATGDDSLWRHTCDSNDTFAAEHAPAAAVREYCPVGELTGNRHTYVAGRGVVVPWHVAGDPRPGVEVCHACHALTDWRWRRGWRHCNVAATYDDDGITCSSCNASMTYAEADERMAG